MNSLSVDTDNMKRTCAFFDSLLNFIHSCYSQAIVADRTVYCSGVLGIDKDSGKLVGGGIENEARKALQNLGKILEAADSSYERIVKTSIFLNDINDFAAVNNVYKECK